MLYRRHGFVSKPERKITLDWKIPKRKGDVHTNLMEIDYEDGIYDRDIEFLCFEKE
jgi:hypothetical protein